MHETKERCPKCGLLKTQESIRPCRCRDGRRTTKGEGLAGPTFIKLLLLVGGAGSLFYLGVLFFAVLRPLLHLWSER